MSDLSTEEYFAISRSLEEHHVLFYMAWRMGIPVFDSSIPTAAVRFDKEGELIQFVFNPDFWASLSNYDRAFVICHECLHVILNHGIRTKDSDNRFKCNIALDIIVNHMLVRNFGFEREKIKDHEDLCWVDTVFKEDVPDDKYFEYYYKLVEENTKKKLVDDHSGLEGPWDSVIDKLCEGLSAEEKEAIDDVVQGHYKGEGTGGIFRFAKAQRPQKKKKWETVIKKWSKKFDKEKDKEVEQWVRLNRRFVTLDHDLILPTEMEVEEDKEHKKIQVWFFQDTSGSCSGFIDRFFKAALTLPEDRFEVKMHCFDTKVFETTLESRKLYGFGGTSFHIIESYIQNYIKKNDQTYPEAVFIITDGFGDRVNPQKPEKWHVFLTTTYKHCFPATCNFYQLRDFE